MLDTLIGHQCDCTLSYVKYNWMSRDTNRSDDNVDDSNNVHVKYKVYLDVWKRYDTLHICNDEMMQASVFIL